MDEYKIYIDKDEIFECEVKIEGASLEDSFSRLILESSKANFLFEGTIKNNKCEIPIKKMKGMLKEGDTGKIKLEIVADDVYFSPWDSMYVVKASKSITINEVKQHEPTKPKVSVEIKEKNSSNSIIKDEKTMIYELHHKIQSNNIGKRTYREKSKKMVELIEEYFEDKLISEKNKKKIVKKMLAELLKS